MIFPLAAGSQLFTQIETMFIIALERSKMQGIHPSKTFYDLGYGSRTSGITRCIRWGYTANSYNDTMANKTMNPKNTNVYLAKGWTIVPFDWIKP
jgi:hypothetical protein